MTLNELYLSFVHEIDSVKHEKKGKTTGTSHHLLLYIFSSELKMENILKKA